MGPALIALAALLSACRGAAPGAPSPGAPDSLVYLRAPALDCAAEPPTAEPCRAHVPWRVADVRARWEAEGAPAWRDGDTLTFVYEGPAERVRVCCTVVLPMARFAGTDLWVLSARVPRIDEGTFSYGFFPDRTELDIDLMTPWRGPGAPPTPAHVDRLRGTLRTDSLDSPALGERRAVTVYLPPGADTTGADTTGAAVVYMADGQQVPYYARYVEPLILDGTLPPVALVGLHAHPRWRGAEYSPVSDAFAADGTRQFEDDRPRYVAQERFLIEEVVPWAERTFGVARRPSRRAVYGASSGASFAAGMALRHPDVFGHAFVFSLPLPGEGFPGVPLPTANRPRFFFASGALESPHFLIHGRGLATRLRGAGFEASYEERVAGHDPVMWAQTFPDALRRAFAR